MLNEIHKLENERALVKIIVDSEKLNLNGSFGKLGSKWSALYAPDLMLAVTLTGQLSLLMLIEELELNDICVVSANTDGIVSLVHKNREETFDGICAAWEDETQFELEATHYNAVYSRDVNNYLAVKTDGSFKGKGIFTGNSLMKNPQGEIIGDAVTAFLTIGIALEETIRQCRDIGKFLTVRRVAGGAVWRDEYLGKVVRWYYGVNGEKITYKKNGNKVSKSDGAMPLMDLSEFPHDIDYNRYIQEAEDVLRGVGYMGEF